MVLIAAGQIQHDKLVLRPPAWAPDVVLEVPIIYQGGRAEKPDESIVKLSFRAGEVSQLYRSLLAEVETVFPVTWKGSVSKEICHARISKWLSDEERAIFEGQGHNAKDACGIGLWKVRRYLR